MAGTLVLTGNDLTFADAERILAGDITSLRLSSDARKRIAASRRCVEQLLAEGATLYGVNTGFGKLSNQKIAPADVLTLQVNLLRSHAVGRGNDLPLSVSRLALALRIQALAKGFSGVTAALLDDLIALFNAGITPVIPELGSVGASGDLAPLAHLALVVIGEGWAEVAGKRMKGSQALRKAKLTPYTLQAKEGLSLINGTQISTAILVSTLKLARCLLRTADIAGAITVEATKSSQRPFDARIQAIRPHPGQKACADNLRRLLATSEIMKSHEHCTKVQDAYSMRCMPQVHGTARDAIDHAIGVVEREMNSATDNPLVFAETREVISGGNFHAQPIALAADLVAAALTDLTSISERRIENLVNPDLSGLPGFLTPIPGLNSGMMIVQVLAAALVAENRSLSFPASTDSIPTSANREDHVSMATAAARKARMVCANLTRVLACEILCGVQGLDFHKPLRPALAVDAVYDLVRKSIPPLQSDRPLHEEIGYLEMFVESGLVLQVAEQVCGQLA